MFRLLLNIIQGLLQQHNMHSQNFRTSKYIMKYCIAIPFSELQPTDHQSVNKFGYSLSLLCIVIKSCKAVGPHYTRMLEADQ